MAFILFYLVIDKKKKQTTNPLQNRSMKSTIMIKFFINKLSAHQGLLQTI